MTKKKNVYTAEFKAEAVKMAESQSITKTSTDLGVSPITLRSWIKKTEFNNSSESTSLNDSLKENKRLQKENQYLKKINEVLKKSTAIFSQGDLPPFK